MIQIDVEDLKIGMYVTGVIDPNTKSSVKRCGVVRCNDIIQQLKDKGIKHVYIDQNHNNASAANKKPSQKDASKNQSSPKKSLKSAPIKNKFSIINSALAESKKVLEDYAKAINSNKKIDVNESLKISNILTDNIILNRDSLLLVTMAKNLNKDLFEHLINTAVLSGIFAKSLGFDRTIIQQIVLAGLFHDIGKVLIPANKMQKDSFSSQDSALLKGHIALGQDMLARQFPSMPVISKNAALQCCERINGSGYPQGLQKDCISFFAKIIAIVDQFEMIRSQHQMDSILNTLKVLLDEADKSLSAPLVHQFIKCIGSYPPGTLVLIQQHHTKRLAIVTHASRQQPTKPEVKVFYNVNSKHYIKMTDLNLSSPSCDFAIQSVSSPREFNIDMDKLLSQYF
jgi:HD-GYP domain-containing protein (c-di-GMP phosphodiesterase class II)